MKPLNSDIKSDVGLRYPFSNESIDSVIAGLDCDGSQNVLSICGSGDVAFALSQYAKNVVAIDSNATQVKFAKRRQSALESQNFSKFIGLMSSRGLQRHRMIEDDDWLAQAQKKYFESRLDALRPKSITFVQGNFLDYLDASEFNSYYLSNVADYGQEGRDFAQRFLFNPAVKKNSLVYFSGGDVFTYGIIRVPASYVVDDGLTGAANRELNIHGDFSKYWQPIVLRKL